MAKVITMVLYNRPQYTKMVLDALRLCIGISEYLLILRIEPGNDEVIELVRNIDFANVRPIINSDRLGGGRNTFHAWEDGFKLSDFIIHIEDDTVPAPDCLQFMEHCYSAYKDNTRVFSVASYNRYPCPSEFYNAISLRRAYTCWLVGTWINRWEWARTNWSKDPARYATHLSRRVIAGNLREVYPLLSRSQNIGIEDGIHAHSARWHRIYHHTEYWAGNCSLTSAPYHEVHNPMVTAIMITGLHPDRHQSARVAIDCFKNQTYGHRELLIINHGDQQLDQKNDARIKEIMIEKTLGQTIGDLRNIALSYATGDLIIHWDDDDWHGSDRMSQQVAAQRGRAAVLLRRQIRFNLLNDSGIYVDIENGIPNTILYPNLPQLKYESVIRNEDNQFLNLFDDIIVVDNVPTLHLMTYDGLNILDERQMMNVCAGSAIAEPIRPDVNTIVSQYSSSYHGTRKPRNLKSLLGEKFL